MKNAAECAIDVFKKRFPFVDHTHGFNAAGLFQLLYRAQATKLAQDAAADSRLTVCEVGSWMGGSARWFASQNNVKSVVCIDHWDRNKIENWYPGRHPEDWMNFMYEQFLANCLHGGVAEKIIPIRMESSEAFREINRQYGLSFVFDLVYLDGAHRTEAVRQDLENYYPMGRILCGDDWCFDQEPENVQLAVTEFADRHRHTVHNNGNLWWLE